jgi:hypothetical protein
VPLEVGHLCGNPWCINYEHLVWCTHNENCRHAPDPDTSVTAGCCIAVMLARGGIVAGSSGITV